LSSFPSLLFPLIPFTVAKETPKQFAILFTAQK
jgi:hypothetical protein